MKFDNIDTAVVIIDPQNDVLSPDGENWDSVGVSVTENAALVNYAFLAHAVVSTDDVTNAMSARGRNQSTWPSSGDTRPR